jgi:Mn2+/Fe2+ NRAMP family transporter
MANARVRKPGRSLWWLAVLGPGVMVMLADTDAGSVITAAQSGAQWGYRLLLPQLLLIPILFGVQEVTVRLGIVTRRGHGTLIRERFGLGWALLSASTLFVACVGAIVTEFSGIAGVGELYGLPRVLTVGLAVLLLLAVVLTGTYRRAERVGIALGALELLFIPAALLVHPRSTAVVHGMASLPLGNHAYLYLLAANVGAVIMPWMVFFQQSAVVDRGLRRTDLALSRWDTLLGSVVTQVIMGAVVIASAAIFATGGARTSLDTVGSIAHALSPFLGWDGARIFFGLGLVGASFVAALVVSLAGSWGVSEVFGWRHSLNDPLPHARKFYWLYAVAVVGGGFLVLCTRNLVNLAVDVEIMNAMLLPIVLGFLLLLEAKALPSADRMRGLHRLWVWGSAVLVSGLGLYIFAATLLCR